MQRALPPLLALLALAGLPSLAAAPAPGSPPAVPENAGTVLWQLDTGG